MSGKYGIPYKGSKSSIANSLIRALPSGKRFVDLFGGGAAKSQVAAQSGKYDEVLYNDIQPNLVKFVQKVQHGDYRSDVFLPEFVTRERFYAEKEDDAYIKYMWSYSNGGFNYMYNKGVEDFKQSIHNYVVFGDRDTYLWETHPKVVLTKTTVSERRIELVKVAKKIYGTSPNVYFMWRLQHLERIERLNDFTMPPIVKYTARDYRKYEHREGDVVYCDVPYKDTDEYDVEFFNHLDFFDWADSRDYPVYFSSYDDCVPDGRFKIVWAITKRNMGAGPRYNCPTRIEALWGNKMVKEQGGNYEQLLTKQREIQMSFFG